MPGPDRAVPCNRSEGGDKMTLLRFCLLVLLWLPLAAAGAETVSRNAEPTQSGPRVLVLGDSMMAFHRINNRSVSHALSQYLDTPVINRAVSGARFLYALPISGAVGMNITKQYRNGKWDWVVLNGGGNDILFGCGCGRCKRKINRLISADGRRGVIPGFVSRLRQSGAQVVFVGYMRTPGVTSPIENCVDEGQEMDRRVAALAKLDRGVHFISLADLVPHGDRSYHAADLVHPSAKGSAAIGRRIADLIRH